MPVDVPDMSESRDVRKPAGGAGARLFASLEQMEQKYLAAVHFVSRDLFEICIYRLLQQYVSVS